jgi:alpha-beta hydrolase superfamily lysophospholipase
MSKSRSYSDSTLSTFTAGDGENLAVQHWPCAQGVRRRGIVVLVHGLGEHAGRYDAMAQHLTSWGFAVHGYDQCGHGESSGARGCLPNTMRLIEDLADVVESAGRRLREHEVLIVLGHGLGGLVASCLVLLRDLRIDGVVLSSPCFTPRLGALQRLLGVLPRVAPNFTLPSGIAAEALSHDDDVVDAYKADPLVHDRISARLLYFIKQAAPRVLARAPRWKLPTLLLYGGVDCVVHPRGSRAFAAAAPRGIVTARCFPDFFHEVFSETESELAYAALSAWLEDWFPAPTAAQTSEPPSRPMPVI